MRSRLLRRRFARRRQRRVARVVLAGLCQCHRRAALDSSALSRAQSIAGRMDLWPLDHGAHEPGTLRLDEPSAGRLSLQGLWRRPRTAGAMVQAGSLGVVRCARRGRILMALRPLQRQALSRLVRLRAHLVSAGDACALAAARCCICPRMAERANATVRASARRFLVSCFCWPFLL